MKGKFGISAAGQNLTSAFIFPGQGSQCVGMGRDLAEAFPRARQVFEEVDEALHENLSRLMFEGPDEELVLTENAQPVLMAVSMAVVRVLEEEVGIDLAEACSFVAGHSLGEYSALAAAKALTLADAALVLKARGRAMQEAVAPGEGAMAALLGLDFEAAEGIARKAAESDVCVAANDNAPDQVVLSGSKAAVERAIALAVEAGAKRSMLLSVSAPFHCSLMAPAAEAMKEVLAELCLSPPVVPLVANVAASAVSDPGEIRRLLLEQVTAMVRWRESVHYMKDQGVDTMIELGAGKVLTGLVRRIDRDLSVRSVGSPADIEAFARSR